MITTYKIPYRDGELRIGWASWDNGEFKSRSIKYAYQDASGKISRGSPELPFDVLVDMLILAADQKEIDTAPPDEKGPPGLAKPTKHDLNKQKKTLTVALMRLQQMAIELPWAKWRPIYEEVGSRLESVNIELAKRR